MVLLAHNQLGVTGYSFLSCRLPSLYARVLMEIFSLCLCCGKLETEGTEKTDSFLPCLFEVKILDPTWLRCPYSLTSLAIQLGVTEGSGQQKTVNPIWSGSSACWLHAQLPLPHPCGRGTAPACAPPPANRTMRIYKRGVCELRSASIRTVSVGSYTGQ